MSKFVVGVVLIMTIAYCFGTQSKLSAEQEEIWRMETKYWQIVEARDREGYIALWDEDFVGWPQDSPAPVRKDAIRSDAFGRFQGLKNFQLDLKAVQVFQDVAVAYYLVTARYAPISGSDEPVAFRCMHTWRRSGSVWHIIGGMSSPAQPWK
jgi:ketosteroid isomerase-like protein